MSVTFATVIYKNRRRRDGTWSVKIRITHNRRHRYIDTPMTEKRTDLTRNLEIRNSSKTCKDKGVEFYLGILRAVWNNLAKQSKTNPHSPFGTEYTIPTATQTRKRDLSKETIQKIINLTDLDGRAALGRDTLLVSLSLCGLNTVDLYGLEKPIDDIIRSQRSKSKHRRDGAHYEMTIPEVIKPYIGFHAGSNGRLFDYADHYSSPENFNAAVNIGLKEVGKLVGIPNLQFYSARHTWASTASNDCGIPLDIIAQSLVHAPQGVTELYVNRSRRNVDKANSAVIEFLFDTAKPFEHYSQKTTP